MTNLKRPRTTITELVNTSPAVKENDVVVGAIGSSLLPAQGDGQITTVNKVYTVDSVATAEQYFGANTSNGKDLVKLIKRLFEEGANLVKAVSIGTPTEGNYSVLTADANAGATSLTVASGAQLSISDEVYIGTEQAYRYEEKRTVGNVVVNAITLDSALTFKHFSGETVRVITARAAADYASAITALERDEDKAIVVCETNDDDTAAALATLCENSYTNFDTPCVYFRGLDSSVTEAQAITKATAQDNDRVVVLFPAIKNFDKKILTGGESAAAVAGAIAGNGIPKLNHNFTDLVGAGDVAANITDFDALVDGGVTAIELKYKTVHIVRFITSYLTAQGIADTSWQEGAIRLNIDNIEKTVQRRVHTKFKQKGNTATTRASIAQEVISILTQFTSQEILVGNSVTGVPAFRDPVVTTDPDDDTKVNVTVEVSPGKPLNFISLTFSVNV